MSERARIKRKKINRNKKNKIKENNTETNKKENKQRMIEFLEQKCKKIKTFSANLRTILYSVDTCSTSVDTETGQFIE